MHLPSLTTISKRPSIYPTSLSVSKQSPLSALSPFHLGLPTGVHLPSSLYQPDCLCQCSSAPPIISLALLFQPHNMKSEFPGACWKTGWREEGREEAAELPTVRVTPATAVCSWGHLPRPGTRLQAVPQPQLMWLQTLGLAIPASYSCAHCQARLRFLKVSFIVQKANFL